MAQLSGKMEADFSEFDTAVNKAVAELNAMAAAADKTSVSVDKVGSGRSFNNFYVSAAQAEKALADMNKASGKSTNTFTTMATALGTADKAFGAMGVHIGPAVGALNEFGTAVEGAGTAVGTLGKAIPVLAAALAGWKIGTKIGEWTGLTKAISDGTAALMGWGDVIEQEALAKMDELDRASKRAKRSISDLGEARRINAEGAAKDKENLEKWSAALKALNDISLDYKKTLDTVDGTVVEGAKALMELGMSVENVATLYGITVQQANAIKQSLDAQKDAATAAAQAFADLAREYEQFAKSQGQAEKDLAAAGKEQRDQVNKERIEQVKKNVEEIKAREAELRDFTMKATLDTTTYQLAQVDIWERGELAAIDAIGGQHTKLTELIKAQAAQRREAIAAEAGAWGSVSRAMAEIAAGRMGVAVIGGERGTTPSNERVDTQTMIQRGKAGGDAYTLNFNVSGVMDPRTQREITDIVADGIFKRTGIKASVR